MAGENGMENGKINSQNSILFAKATNTQQMTSFMREKLSEAMCEMRALGEIIANKLHFNQELEI